MEPLFNKLIQEKAAYLSHIIPNGNIYKNNPLHNYLSTFCPDQ